MLSSGESDHLNFFNATDDIKRVTMALSMIEPDCPGSMFH